METELLLFGICVLFLGLFSGACTALEILSLGRQEKPSDEDEDANGFTGGLAADPIHGGIALGLARAITFALTIVAAVKVGSELFPEGRTALLAGFVVVSLFVPIFTAKILAVHKADRFLHAVRYVTHPIAYMLHPAAVLTGRLARRLSPSFTRLISFEIVPLKQKIEMFGAPEGQRVDEEQMMMSSLLDFGDTKVREVMVPRIDIVAVNAADDLDEAAQTIIEAGHSRIPLYEETIDRIVGTIYTKDLLRKYFSGEDFELRELAREAFFVPESKNIDELLSEFKRRKQHLAVVVDEYGGTAGIVTMEDVLEEIVGDIQDEFDVEEPLVERADSDSAVVRAKVRLDELADHFGVTFPEGEADSLGGLLYKSIGRVPRVGDRVAHGSLTFEIVSVQRQRIDKVLIRGLSSDGDRTEDGAA